MSGARPRETIAAVRRSIENSAKLTQIETILEKEPDMAGADAGVHLPLISIQPTSNIRLNNFNTDQVRFTYDADGNQTGRVFNARYNLALQIDVWTAAQSGNDAEQIGEALWDVLYKHDSAGPGLPLKDANGNPLNAVWKFSIRQGEPAHDLTMTPTLRRWRVEVEVWAKNEFTTTEDYITSVNYPNDLSDDDSDGTLTG